MWNAGIYMYDMMIVDNNELLTEVKTMEKYVQYNWYQCHAEYVYYYYYYG